MKARSTGSQQVSTPHPSPPPSHKRQKLGAVSLLTGLLGVVSLFGAAMTLERFTAADKASTRSVTAIVNDITETSKIRITNCNSKKTTVGPKSPFWDNHVNQNHMNVSVSAFTAGVAVELMNEFGALKSEGKIVDMGSGLLSLKAVLPEQERHRYIPVDVVERVPGSGTVVCNTNLHEFPLFLNEKVAAFAFLGSFEYVLDKMTVLHLCRQHQGAHIVMVSLSSEATKRC
jgi:hypothetical protein